MHTVMISIDEKKMDFTISGWKVLKKGYQKRILQAMMKEMEHKDR